MYSKSKFRTLLDSSDAFSLNLRVYCCFLSLIASLFLDLGSLPLITVRFSMHFFVRRIACSCWELILQLEGTTSELIHLGYYGTCDLPHINRNTNRGNILQKISLALKNRQWLRFFFLHFYQKKKSSRFPMYRIDLMETNLLILF